MSEGEAGGAPSPAWRHESLAPGLHLLATPIGNARDITLRALDVLASADVLAAEDTRAARRLMEIHAIPRRGRPLLPYHDRGGPAQRPRLMTHLEAGRSVAYVSDAGTPLVADPGYRLATEAVAAGLPVHVAPGPSAVLAALSLAGLPSDRFLFAGFAPAARAARRRWLQDLAGVPATLVFFETARRVSESFADLCETWGEDRRAALCREMTKRFEEVRRGTLGDLARSVAETPPRGELVIVVDRKPADGADPAAVDSALRGALARAPVRQAADEVAAAFGRSRREMYQAALRIRAGDEDGQGDA